MPKTGPIPQQKKGAEVKASTPLSKQDRADQLPRNRIGTKAAG